MSAMFKKTLIAVAIPLDAINREAAREKSIRHGHPSTLHLWWARRPLAACRAVLFASLVDDPSAHPDRFPTEADQLIERDRLFAIIEDLVKWDNSDNLEVLERARAEIIASCDGDLPRVLDPFAGGGSIPLEAQRLGLIAHASDLNPVAVLINKALVEIPPRFAGSRPVHPEEDGSRDLKTWSAAQGLADDVRFYGRWIRDEAQRRIGHLYPRVELPPKHGGGEATVIAWIWARTVECPNPACGATTPLTSTYVLSSRKGKERWIVPSVRGSVVAFSIGGPLGEAPSPPKLGRGARFACSVCAQAMDDSHLKAEGAAGRLGAQLMAVVAEGEQNRIYLAPDDVQVAAADIPRPADVPHQSVPDDPRNVWCKIYGYNEWQQLFTPRQLAALATHSDLVSLSREIIYRDAVTAGLADDSVALRDGGSGAQAYAEAVSVYLAFALDKMVDRNSTLCAWEPVKTRLRGTFQRQALPMTWDFVEANPFGDAGGDYSMSVFSVWEVLQKLVGTTHPVVEQRDAASLDQSGVLVSTDPPYYDNIGYADLSDFFYVWLRRSLNDIYPDEFSTLLVPKSQELIASPYRFGGDKGKAEGFFEAGLRQVFDRLHEAQDQRFPLTVYYAFKQAESTKDGTASTGWETMLQSLLLAGFTIDGTWPLRSELANRMIASGTNALASSIVLACRRRPIAAPLATRKEFIERLKAELPGAVRTLQHGSIAPVDLAQAAIGPGMSVFSRYSKVVEADGATMRVRTALELINQVLDETIAGTDSDFDGDTRWAVTWFEDCGMGEGDFGRAEQLSKSRNTSVPGLAEAGIVTQRPSKVRLTAREELSADWDPRADKRLTVWEVTQHLIRRFETGGESAAAGLLIEVGSGLGETAKELAYRLYLICDRKGWAKEAVSYNALVAAWPELTRLAASTAHAGQTAGTQGELL